MHCRAVTVQVRIDELSRYLRVVTLEDGTTVHNAFPDRHASERADLNNLSLSKFPFGELLAA